MNRLTQDGTAKPVSRDQILRRERADRKIIVSPVQLTTTRKIGNLTRLIHTHAIYVMVIRAIWETFVLQQRYLFVALLSSPVSSTNEGPRIQYKFPGETEFSSVDTAGGLYQLQ